MYRVAFKGLTVMFIYFCSSRVSGLLSAMPQFIMSSTHPDHEDYAKPNWREEILVFCNNYRCCMLAVFVLSRYHLEYPVCLWVEGEATVIVRTVAVNILPYYYGGT